MIDGKASYLLKQTCWAVPWPSNMKAFASRVTHPSGVVERGGKALMYRWVLPVLRWLCLQIRRNFHRAVIYTAGLKRKVTIDEALNDVRRIEQVKGGRNWNETLVTKKEESKKWFDYGPAHLRLSECVNMRINIENLWWASLAGLASSWLAASADRIVAVALPYLTSVFSELSRYVLIEAVRLMSFYNG